MGGKLIPGVQPSMYAENTGEKVGDSELILRTQSLHVPLVLAWCCFANFDGRSSFAQMYISTVHISFPLSADGVME